MSDQRDVSEALDAAQLAIEEYYNGDRAWAEEWLLRASEAQKPLPQPLPADCDFWPGKRS
jgi:hypothetical protein